MRRLSLVSTSASTVGGSPTKPWHAARTMIEYVPDLELERQLKKVVDGFWIDAREFLEQSGYKIHPKYNPTWTPTSELEEKEANVLLPRFTLASALRVKNNEPVILKQVEINTPEFELAVFFSSPPLSTDLRNHCVPIYDVLQFGKYGIIVMPQLRLFNDAPFDTVGEVLECFRQILEGVQFMHQHHVAHRDCTLRNIMMDPTKMYPEGFHPGRPWMTADYSEFVSPRLTRAQCWPRYYLVDFGLSRRYDPTAGIPDEPVICGEDKTAPEHHDDSRDSCNPFPTDIYYIGNILREYFIDATKYGHDRRLGLEFLRPLMQEMVQDDPTRRPTIDEVVKRFHDLTQSLSYLHLRSLVQLSDANSILYPVNHFGRWMKFTLTLKAALPKDTPPPLALLSPDLHDFYTQNRDNGLNVSFSSSFS
ncbi:kinase-like domain-containing protein [Armillaria mellea]|nr:kinase-like domain-containing protein [Armillaria mellea]